MIRLALLRHGPTAWNREGRIQGSSDIALDAEARAMLAGLALPPPWDGAELWSSPLKRAVETARLVAGRPARLDSALREMHWGDWEGQRGAELLADPGSGYAHIENWGWDFRPLRGESPREVRGRLEPWLAALTRDAVVVCHIGVMRVLLAIAHGWDFAGPAPFKVKRNRLFVVGLEGGRLSALGEPVRLVAR